MSSQINWTINIDNVEEENKIEKPLYTQEQENEKQHKASIPQYVMVKYFPLRRIKNLIS